VAVTIRNMKAKFYGNLTCVYVSLKYLPIIKYRNGLFGYLPVPIPKIPIPIPTKTDKTYSVYFYCSKGIHVRIFIGLNYKVPVVASNGLMLYWKLLGDNKIESSLSLPWLWLLSSQVSGAKSPRQTLSPSCVPVLSASSLESRLIF
jgi:hypothetical protein